VKILLIADEEDKYLWDFYRPGCLDGVDLILSAGDLKSEYLRFLVTMANCPLVYVHGNHDGPYSDSPPEGCECADDRLITVKGLRILGLGGSARYSSGKWQYTESQMRARIRRLWWRLVRAGGVDIVLTHAPIRGMGDQEDHAHRGFAAFIPLLEKWKPRYLVHGHVHKSYGADFQRVRNYGDTTVINACGRYWLEIEK